MGELSRLEEQLESVGQRRETAIAKAEAEAEKARQPLERQRAALLTSLEQFCRQHEREFGRVNGHGRRSRRLLLGRVGFRASQAIVVGEEAKALRALARWEPGEKFLRVRTELDRESLRDFLLSSPRAPAAIRKRLRRAGIYLERRQHWFYEIDPRAVHRWGGGA